MMLVGDPRVALRELSHPDARQILIISVSAHARPKAKWSIKRAAPGLGEVIGSLSADLISHYGLDTIDIVRSSCEKWTKELSTPERPVFFNFVEVSFDAVQDDAERENLNTIGTNFNLHDEQVDSLITAAGKVLNQSKEFQEFLERNQGKEKTGVMEFITPSHLFFPIIQYSIHYSNIPSWGDGEMECWSNGGNVAAW